jgi:acetyl esterase
MSEYTRGDTPLDPQVAELLQTMAAAKAVRTLDVAAQRAFDDAATEMYNAGVQPLPIEKQITIPTSDGELRALVFASQPRSDAARPVVLHLHGGGFVLFRPETTARISRAIATNADVIVVSLDYRRAPEHPYPAPLDDCVTAFRWLRANAAELGGDPRRIAVAGDSAGGSLAAATALRLLAEGEPPPEAVVLISAWIDLTMSSPSSRRFGPDDPLIDDDVLSFWRGCYAPDEAQWRDPMLSPCFGDLSAFPPVCVVAGAIDPFCDEGVHFAKAAAATGRDAELHVYEGMPHWFPMLPPTAPLTDYDQRVGAFLTRVLNPSS